MKIFRLARLLRPLRLVGKDDGLKTAMGAINSSLPKILNQMMIVILFFSVVAIIGINMIKGLHEYCITDEITLSQI